MSQLTGPMIAEAATWLTIVSKLFTTRMGALLDPHGLTVGQFSILNHVARKRIDRGNSVSEIAAAVEVEQPAVTKTLAKFQNMGLVEIKSSPTDKRAKVVTATPQAGALLGQIYADMGPDLMQVFGTLQPDDLAQFTGQLKQLGQWLDRNRLEP